MRRTEALQGVRMAMFLNILHRWESAELNQGEGFRGHDTQSPILTVSPRGDGAPSACCDGDASDQAQAREVSGDMIPNPLS